MKRLVIGSLAALTMGLTGCSATGGAPLHPVVPASVLPTPVAADRTATPTHAPVPTKYFIGDTVHNGSLRFTVDSTHRTKVVHDQIGGYYPAANGNEFVIVKLSVWNESTQSVYFYYTQTLALHGQQISGDNAATYALNPAINTVIQPGLGIPIQMAFLVPEGAQPEAAIMLSDALYAISHPGSPATRVELVKP
jgi:hypothetical protein